jgi:hypothetical protein
MRRPCLTVAALLVCVASRPATGQVLRIEGGGGSLEGGAGALVTLWTRGLQAAIGAGWQDGDDVQLAGHLERGLRGGDTLRVGDDVFPMRLATDAFGAVPAQLLKGVTLRGTRGRLGGRVAAGWLGRGAAAARVSAIQAQRPAALAALTWRLRPALQAETHVVAAERPTLLTGVAWRPERPLAGGRSEGALAAGVGGGAPYAAASGQWKSPTLDVSAALAASGHDFRRAPGGAPGATESDGANVMITWRPAEALALGAGRQALREVLPDTATRGPSRAQVVQGFARWTVRGLAIAGGVYGTSTRGDSARARSVGAYTSASRDFGRRMSAELFVFHVRPDGGEPTFTPVLHVREHPSTRLSLVQVVSVDAGRPRVAFGGTWTAGLLALGADWQMVHAPFRAASPFVQTLALDARVPVGRFTLAAGTVVLPDGQVRYRVGGTTFVYPGGGAEPVGTRLSRFAVRGRVVDEAGRPVAGAAVSVDGEVAYTGRDGAFLMRRARARPVAFAVVPEEFLDAPPTAVISVPTRVTPVPDEWYERGRETPLVVVVRRAQAP